MPLKHSKNQVPGLRIIMQWVIKIYEALVPAKLNTMDFDLENC